jgi:hypothetical protein
MRALSSKAQEALVRLVRAMVWIVLMIVIAGVVLFLWRRGVAHAGRVNQYYLFALGAWFLCGDDKARVAALTAAKIADPAQRVSMIAALEQMVSRLVEGSSMDKAHMLEQTRRFVADLNARDWTVTDLIRAKNELRTLDQEYANALERAEPNVFPRRWPALRPQAPDGN